MVEAWKSLGKKKKREIFHQEHSDIHPGDNQQHKMVTASSASSSSSLKEYLKRYESNVEEEKKKKKKKKKPRADATGVVVVDEDPIWQKQVNIEEENDSADEEKPQIDEDIEVKRMKRLEELRVRRPFGVISEDGSGWIPVSDNPNSSNAGDQVSDMSPPRRITRNDTPSPRSESRPFSTRDTDLSPQRKRRFRNDTPSPEHEQQPSSKANADLSPPRKRRSRNDTPSPEREQQPFSKANADLSPPRKRRARNDTPSPHHKLKASSTTASDLSPPRQRRKRYGSPSRESDISASRTLHTLPYEENLGASPAGDLSPPRKSRKDRLPPQYPVSENDAAISDLSPPRRNKKKSPVPKRQPKTGLVTGRDVKEEVTKTKMEEWSRFKEMDPSVSGRGAEGVYRDKITGKRMSKEEFLESQKKVKDEKPKEIKLEWGKGLAQKREAEDQLKELELEKEKPFARTRDDPELDRMLKDRLRWGDPMAHLVKKKPLESVLPNFGDNEKVKESGFIIPQEVPNHSWIKRGLDAPPNRYGIKPGRHWDGVDRSNGTEKASFKRKNEKQATEKEAYLWSVADM